MQALNEMYVEIKPIFNTYSFQLKKNWKKLVFFIVLSVVFVLLLSYLPFVLIPDNNFYSYFCGLFLFWRNNMF
jgi:hypothetical protein